MQTPEQSRNRRSLQWRVAKSGSARYSLVERLTERGLGGCRQWMRAVLQPLNEKAKDIIVKHADLLQSSQMEPLLLQLVAHVSAYRVILQRCAQSDLKSP